MIELSPQLELAPVALLVLDADDVIVTANLLARDSGFECGVPVSRYVTGVPQSLRAAIDGEPDTRSWRFRFADREKRYDIRCICEEGMYYCWLFDQSENIALAEKARQLKDPGSRRLRQINHQAATAMGYAELLEVIMADHEVLTAEKLAAVRQYQSEVSSALQNIQQVAQQDKENTKASSTSILVADSHAALSELISELLRAEGYRVTSFTDGESAYKYCKVNRHAIRKAIMDEGLRSNDNRPLVAALQEMKPSLEIVTLTDDTENNAADSILKPVDFQLLLRAVED